MRDADSSQRARAGHASRVRDATPSEQWQLVVLELPQSVGMVADPPADFQGAAEPEADGGCDRDSELAERTDTADQPLNALT